MRTVFPATAERRRRALAHRGGESRRRAKCDTVASRLLSESMLRNGASSHRFLDPFIRRRTRQRRGVITRVAAPGDGEVTRWLSSPLRKGISSDILAFCRRTLPHAVPSCLPPPSRRLRPPSRTS